MNFFELYETLENKSHEPLKYNLKNVADDFSIVGNTISKSVELTPLSDEDMNTTSADEVVADLEIKKKAGWNPTRLGEPLDDEGMKKYTGTWFN